MKTRYKTPNGHGVVEIADNATVELLFGEIQKKTGFTGFTIKYGLPGAMKSIGVESNHTPAKSLGLHGETVTVVPDEPIQCDMGESNDTQPHKSTQPVPKSDKHDPQDAVVPWPEREGSLSKQLDITSFTKRR